MTIYKLKPRKPKEGDKKTETNEYGTIRDFVFINGDWSVVHYKNSNGDEFWYDYDEKGNKIHYKDSYGDEYWECWWDENNNAITEEEFNKIWEAVE